MRGLNVGTPAATYYRGTQGGVTQSYDSAAPISASATGSLSQSASGNVSVGGHPGVWLIFITAGLFIWLHRTNIANAVEG